MNYDVIVIGGGHSGIEASLASARMGCKDSDDNNTRRADRSI